jgi:hypothetical protein
LEGGFDLTFEEFLEGSVFDVENFNLYEKDC